MEIVLFSVKRVENEWLTKNYDKNYYRIKQKNVSHLTIFKFILQVINFYE
jgi:hypothetical protein